MAEIKRTSNSLRYRAMVACGEIENDALDFLEAMYSDDYEDEMFDMAVRSNDEEIECKIAFEVPCVHNEISLLEKFNSDSESFFEVFLDDLLGHLFDESLELGMAKSIIEEINRQEIDFEYQKFSLYREIEERRPIFGDCALKETALFHPKPTTTLMSVANGYVVVSSMEKANIVCFRVGNDRAIPEDEQGSELTKLGLLQSRSHLTGMPCIWDGKSINIGPDIGLLSMISGQIEN